METAEIPTYYPDTDEKIMAALSNGAVLLPLMGIIVPIVIWVTQKDKSRFVAFQALQATVYQLIMFLLYFFGMACYLLSFFTLFFTVPLSGSGSSAAQGALVLFPFLVLGLFLLIGIIYVIYGLVGAILVLFGKNFHYVFIGRSVENYINNKTT